MQRYKGRTSRPKESQASRSEQHQNRKEDKNDCLRLQVKTRKNGQDRPKVFGEAAFDKDGSGDRDAQPSLPVRSIVQSFALLTPDFKLLWCLRL